MKIDQALTLLPTVGLEKKSAEKTARDATVSFGETLNQAVKDVNNLQTEADRAVNQMIDGKDVDLHDVMIAAEKAKTSFDLLMEIRNKAISAYQELMRIQV
ncbi:MAG TPA: flagellar hook-basal body complex protein FliE [Bacteroidota bacterium]|nr:flagellar hook-basal body complex protein FliE [Bacteroidota bacterium]